MKDVLEAVGYGLMVGGLLYSNVQYAQYNVFSKAASRGFVCQQRDLTDVEALDFVENLGAIVAEKVYCDEVPKAEVVSEEVPIYDIFIERIDGKPLEGLVFLTE